MSYHGLGVDTPSPSAPTPWEIGGAGGGVRGGADPRDTMGLVPPECASLQRYSLPPDTIQPSQVLVTIFPFVKASPSKMPAVLAQITGPRGEGGPVLVRFVERLRARAGAGITFVSAGWMRDEASVQSTTKGLIWVALRPKNAQPRGTMARDAKMLVEEAFRAEGLSADARSPSASRDIDMAATWSALSPGTSDEELLRAVYRAAGGAASFAAFVRYVGAAARMGRQAATLKAAFAQQTQQVQSAMALVQGIGSIATQVRNLISQAMALPKSEQAQAITLLDTGKATVDQAKSLIRTAVGIAPAFVAQATVQREEVIRAVRIAVLNVADADIRRGSPFELAREYLRCSLLARAKPAVDDAMAAVETALEQGSMAAQWLVNNAPAIDAAMAVLDALSAELEEAYAQVPLGWLMRKRWGLPTWGWLGLGGGAFIGGAFVVRGLKKKGKRS